MGKTISEKIFQMHCGKECRADDLVIADIDFLMVHDASRPQAYDVFQKLGGTKVFDPQKIVYFIDHQSPAPGEVNARVHSKIRKFCSEHSIQSYENEGICHQIVAEKGHAVPGNLVVASDSHTCTYGALNLFAAGVGSTDSAAVMLTGQLWFKVPRTIKFQLTGKLPPGVFSKDLILYLIGQVTADGATYKAVEFVGEAITDLSIDARLTISNMAVEMGAKAGMMEPDEKLLEWVKARTSKPLHPVSADKDALYDQVYEYNVTTLSPQIAKPHNVDNVASIEEIGDVPIQQANLGTCTNGRLEDLAIAAKILKGKKVHPEVRLLLAPASRSILIEGMKKGIIQTLIEAGAVMTNPSCALCAGGAAYGIPSSGEAVVTSANRNFKGRLANAESFIYLASPATVAASALEGRIADCRKYLGG